MDILPIDCNYVVEEFAASFLLVHGSMGLFVECNTNHAIPYLKLAAEKVGLSAGDVVGLIITHVHLDHAGGAGLFLQTFPNAKVYAHPRAARHLIDPSKLVASATAVYGEARMHEWYGTIQPCDPARVVILEDGDTVEFAGEKLATKHLRGHANHHLVVIEPLTQTLFSGDSFGVAYPQLKHLGQDVIIASTSPTDFDGPAALAAVDWIVASKPKQVALTHYGFIPGDRVAADGEILKAQIQYAQDLLKDIVDEKLTVDVVEAKLQSFLAHYFEAKNLKLSEADFRLLIVDIKVNAQGLHYAANKNLVKQ